MQGLVNLDNRTVVEVRGVDAGELLQGIITNDINSVDGQNALYAGLLTPQGKLLFDFFLLRHDERFLIDLDKSLAEDFCKRLIFYRLRAAVEIENRPDLGVAALWTDQAVEKTEGMVFSDPRMEKAGSRVILPIGNLPAMDEASLGSWHAHRIACGLPEGGADFTYGNCFPHDIGMDQLNGISFQKGCYVGQEVVSRMQHRGTARKRPMIVQSENTLPASPANVVADGVTLGRLGSVSGNLGLAEIRLDRAAAALEKSATGFMIEETKIRLFRPHWSSYGEDFEAFPVD